MPPESHVASSFLCISLSNSQYPFEELVHVKDRMQSCFINQLCIPVLALRSAVFRMVLSVFCHWHRGPFLPAEFYRHLLRVDIAHVSKSNTVRSTGKKEGEYTFCYKFINKQY